MKNLPRTLVLTFLLGALVGLLEGLGVLVFLGLGFGDPGLELMGVAWRSGIMALLCLPLAFAVASLLRLPRKTSIDLAAWAALGLAWVIGNWWVQGEVFRRVPIFRPLPLLSLLGSSLAVFVLHAAMRRAAKAAPQGSRNALLGALILLPLIAQFTLSEATTPNEHSAESESLPDVTVVVIDTLRADHLGTYGYQREDGEVTSPNIDAFAQTGVVFENTWSQAPWTRPSMASLHSGLFCSGHTVNQVYDMLPKDATTLAEMANERGYRTAGFSANANVGVTYGFGQGFEQLWTVGKPRTLSTFTRWGELEHIVVNKILGGFLYDGDDHAALVNDRTFAWLDEVAQDPRPKFTYVHYIDPHTPYLPPEGGFLFDGEIYDVEAAIDDLKLKRTSRVQEFPFEVLPDPSAAMVRETIRMYDSEIRYVDQEFEKLLAGLRQRGLLDAGDWLILTSDHGEEFYEHGRFGHGQSLFEDQLHVPLIVVGPGVVAGARQAQEVNMLDIHQTVAEIVGYEWPTVEGAPTTATGHPSASISLLPLMNGEEDLTNKRLLYAERLQDNIELRAARQDFLKIIEIPDFENSTEQDHNVFRMWFNLNVNPEESIGISVAELAGMNALPRDLDAFDPAKASINLNDLLGKGKGQAMIGGVKSAGAALSPDALRALKELGYIDEDGNPIHGK
jgi:arylsulfatase A-like enzyme